MTGDAAGPGSPVGESGASRWQAATLGRARPGPAGPYLQGRTADPGPPANSATPGAPRGRAVGWGGQPRYLGEMKLIWRVCVTGGGVGTLPARGWGWGWQPPSQGLLNLGPGDDVSLPGSPLAFTLSTFTIPSLILHELEMRVQIPERGGGGGFTTYNMLEVIIYNLIHSFMIALFFILIIITLSFQTYLEGDVFHFFYV